MQLEITPAVCDWIYCICIQSVGGVRTRKQKYLCDIRCEAGSDSLTFSSSSLPVCLPGVNLKKKVPERLPPTTTITTNNTTTTPLPR